MPLENVSEEITLGNYINRLKPKTGAELRILESANLGWAMDLAHKIEARFQLTQNCREWGGTSNFQLGFNQRPVLVAHKDTRVLVGVGEVAAKRIG